MEKDNETSAKSGALLSKSVAALAIEPLSMALTVTSRKAYDVMLWIAQRQTPNEDGFYSSPVTSILKGYGSDARLSERLQEYIEHMVQTTVVWRPLAVNDPVSLTLDGMEAENTVTDEQRTFPLLAEVRRFQRGGQAWVSWFYPPSIREGLIRPERWAQIELSTIARLSTYTAVALYEICVRYKDAIGGLSGRYEPDFLGRVLREQTAKPRPWRKFKHELVGPAIAEINAVSEIDVELIEHRRGRSVSHVQFKVARKAKSARRESESDPVDVSLSMEASSLGIRDSELDNLVVRFGPEKVQQALGVLQAQRSRPGGANIAKPGAYLTAILLNLPKAEEGGRVSGAAEPRQVSTSNTSGPPKQEAARAAAPVPVAPASGWEALRVNALKILAERFASLGADERKAWMTNLTVARPEALTPGSRRRLDAGQWESPVVKQLVLTHYAEQTHGPEWVRAVLE